MFSIFLHCAFYMVLSHCHALSQIKNQEQQCKFWNVWKFGAFHNNFFWWWWRWLFDEDSCWVVDKSNMGGNVYHANLCVPANPNFNPLFANCRAGETETHFRKILLFFFNVLYINLSTSIANMWQIKPAKLLDKICLTKIS